MTFLSKSKLFAISRVSEQLRHEETEKKKGIEDQIEAAD